MPKKKAPQNWHSVCFLGQQPARTTHVDHTVHEHRAPTDESVRLLKDMEEAAKEKIVASLYTPQNTFGSTWLISRKDFGFEHEYVCRYSLNGVAHEFKTTEELIDHRTQEELLKSVFEKFSKHFAAHFVPSLLENHHSKKGGAE